MAAWSRTPFSLTAIDAADITSGPQKKRIDMEIAAIFPPQAMIRGCNAINSPKMFHKNSINNRLRTNDYYTKYLNLSDKTILRGKERDDRFLPKLNIAIPSPASEIIFIEFFSKLGIPTFHL